MLLASVVMMRPPSQRLTCLPRDWWGSLPDPPRTRNNKALPQTKCCAPIFFLFCRRHMVIFVLPHFPTRDFGRSYEATETRPCIGFVCGAADRGQPHPLSSSLLLFRSDRCSSFFEKRRGSCPIGRKPRVRERVREEGLCAHKRYNIVV